MQRTTTTLVAAALLLTTLPLVGHAGALIPLPLPPGPVLFDDHFEGNALGSHWEKHPNLGSISHTGTVTVANSKVTMRHGTYFPYMQRDSSDAAGAPWVVDFDYQYIGQGVLGDGMGISLHPGHIQGLALCLVHQSIDGNVHQQFTLLGPEVDGSQTFRRLSIPIDFAPHRMTCGWNGVELYLNVDGQRVLSTWIWELPSHVLDALVEDGFVTWIGNSSKCCPTGPGGPSYNPLSVDRVTLSLGPRT